MLTLTLTSPGGEGVVSDHLVHGCGEERRGYGGLKGYSTAVVGVLSEADYSQGETYIITLHTD